MKKIIFICISCLIIDQLLKLSVSTMVLNSSLKIINNFFSLTYVHNYGAAFSILTGNKLFLILITIFALIFIYYFLIKNEKRTLINDILYGVLYGGILGNLVDRIFRGYVIDYLDFNIFGYSFPIFNFADICIVISIILIMIISIRGNKNGANSNW